MGVGELVTITESAICLMLLLILMAFLVPCLRLDEFRQAMFEVRDELFDFALAGKIRFDDPAYRLLRHEMNGFIRYAHQLTFYRLVCTLTHWKALGQEPATTWATRWEAALKQMTPEAAAELKNFHSRALGLVVKRLVTGSPMLILALILMIIGAIFQTQWVSLKQLARAAAADTVNRMIGTSLIEEEAARA